jgi:flagellar M-ring protein FliF
VTTFSSDRSKNTKNTQPLPSGRPGAAPNGVGNTSQAISTEAGANSESTETNTEQEVVPSRVADHIETVPLAPTKVKVSIGVPSSYYEKVWRERNPSTGGAAPATPDAAGIAKIETEVKKEIEEAVVNLLPVPEPGGDPYTPVRVTSFTDIPVAADPPAGFVEEATSWLAGNWPTLGMTLLGLLSLLLLRGMLRSTAAAPPPSPAARSSESAAAPASAASGEADAVDEAVDLAQQRRLRVRRAGGPSLRDELVEMVKEDPDAAANVIRNWIGDAA